jgi:hypothetical protein
MERSGMRVILEELGGVGGWAVLGETGCWLAPGNGPPAPRPQDRYQQYNDNNDRNRSDG